MLMISIFTFQEKVSKKQNRYFPFLVGYLILQMLHLQDGPKYLAYPFFMKRAFCIERNTLQFFIDACLTDM